MQDDEHTDGPGGPQQSDPPSVGPEDRDAAAALVVGVGASAGGLDALQRFVGDLRAGVRAAYVIVQHLSPDHPSLMVEILERHTELPVVRITDRSPLTPDTIHVPLDS